MKLAMLYLSMLSTTARSMSICRMAKLPKIRGSQLLHMSTYSETERISFSVTSTPNMQFSGDMLVVPFYKPVSKKDDELKLALIAAIPTDLPDGAKEVAIDMIQKGEFSADPLSKQYTRLSSSFPMKYIALLGLGPAPKRTLDTPVADIEVQSAARIGRMISNLIKETKVETVGIALPCPINNAGITQCLLGVHDVAYTDNRYKKLPDSGVHKSPFTLKSVVFLGLLGDVGRDVGITSSLTNMIASGVTLAKDLVGSPPNYKTPVTMAEVARKIAKDNNLDITVLGKEECESRGMGAYLGVQQGSAYPPQFVHMTYKPTSTSSVSKDKVVKVALVGKGLTFDSGGYNLKAGAGSMIELMKFDMGGCGAVFGCAKAIGQLRPKNVEVHFISAICENMVSAEAMRPGDILVASNGKTIEVLNTDAEGRLTLADALVYADKLDVDYIIDLATLTGACIVGLGEKIAALYTPDKELRDALENAAKRCDEGLWSLPLEQGYKEMIKSNLADLKNIGGKGGGSITAALFLQEFVEKAKWAHIDMAGPVWDSAGNKATGYGVKLLTDFLLTLKK